MLIVIGTLHPVSAALAFTSGRGLMPSPSNPEVAVRNLADEIEARAWERAYANLANKAEFTQDEFESDLMGFYPSLRTYAAVDPVRRVTNARVRQ